MTTKTKTSLLCDLPDDVFGDPEHPARRTVAFSLGRSAWEADMCDGHVGAMAAALHPFISAARPVRSAPARKRPAGERRRSAAMRAWARDRGLVTGDRGRMPNSVVAKYEAAHRGQR